MSPKPSPARVWTALLTVYLVWGSTYLGIEVAVRTLPPFLMLAVRFLLAGALLYAWSALKERPRRRATLREWRAALVVAAALLLVGNGAVAWAEDVGVETGTAALIIASVPLWLALLDRIAWGQRLSRWAVAGLLTGFAGVALLVTPGASGAAAGGLVLISSSLAWAAGSLYSRRAPSPSPLRGAAMQMLSGGVLLAVFSLAVGEAAELRSSEISLESLLGLAYLVVFGSLAGFSAYIWLLRVAPTSLVGTYAYVNPVVAVLLGTTLLGEPLTWRTVVGGVVVLAAVALIVTPPRARPGKAALAVPARGR